MTIGVRRRLRLRSWWLNTVAASPLWAPATRARLLRLAGVDVRGTLWHGATIVGTELTIEPDAFVNVGATFGAGAAIVIRDGAAIGQNVILSTGDHELGGSENRAGPLTLRPITIGRGAWIGAGCIIHGGVTVGDGCVVASGSVVTDDLEPNGLYAGSPARRRRDLDDRPAGS